MNLWMGTTPQHSGSPPTSSCLCTLTHEVRAQGSQRKLQDHLTEFWRENPGWSGQLCCWEEWPCGSCPSSWTFTPEDSSLVTGDAVARPSPIIVTDTATSI